MRKLRYGLLTGMILTLPIAVLPQRTRTVKRTGSQAPNNQSKSVPAEYIGTWVCQTVLPGLTTIHSNVNVNTGVLEQTTTTTVPGVVAIKFNLKADGTYEAPNAKGHYSFDPATKALTWIDGLHQAQFTKTELDKRPNGAPSMHLINLKRYWGCFKAEKNVPLKSGNASSKPGTTAPTKATAATPVLANPNALAYAAPIVNDGVAQLARQAAAIRIRGVPNLAQLAQLTISRGNGPPQNILEEPTNNEVKTRFLRSTYAWFKPWGWGNEVSKRVPWDDPTAPRGSGFARQQSARETLTKLFSACLDYYEQQANVEQYRTDDVAVTYSHSIALNTEVSTGRKLTAQEEMDLREQLRNKIAYYPYNFDDSSKQAMHETIVIITMLTQAGYAEATLNNDQQAQAAFRETARRNVDTLTRATIYDLLHAGWGPGN